MARLLRIDGMLSRTESIDGFHLKVSRTERGLYEEFLKTEEAGILAKIYGTISLRRNSRVAESDSSRKLSGQSSKTASRLFFGKPPDDQIHRVYGLRVVLFFLFWLLL